MSKHFVQSDLLRKIAIAGLRAQARLRPNRDLPKLFVTSVPKSGTHLLMGDVERLTGLSRSWLHINNRDVAESMPGGTPPAALRLDVDAFDAQVRRVRMGQYFTAHMYWSQELSSHLREHQIKSIFVYRDPRAVMVSQFHYVLGLKRHHLHKEFLQQPDDAARYRLLIFGSKENPGFPPMRQRLGAFRGWIEDETVLSLKFEDLVGERGGGSGEARRCAIAEILQHLGLADHHAGDLSQTNSKPKATFREGRTDGWRKSLSPEIFDLFAQECGELLVGFGYDPD